MGEVDLPLEPESIRRLTSCAGVPTWNVAKYPSSLPSMFSPTVLAAVGVLAGVTELSFPAATDGPGTAAPSATDAEADTGAGASCFAPSTTGPTAFHVAFTSLSASVSKLEPAPA